MRERHEVLRAKYGQDDASGIAQSGCRGYFSPGSHSTPHAGPRGALPPDWKGSPEDDDLQRWLRYWPPTPFHPVGCRTVDEVHSALSLPKVPAFTVSHPLR